MAKATNPRTQNSQRQRPKTTKTQSRKAHKITTQKISMFSPPTTSSHSLSPNKSLNATNRCNPSLLYEKYVIGRIAGRRIREEFAGLCYHGLKVWNRIFPPNKVPSVENWACQDHEIAMKQRICRWVIKMVC